jgi:hypothetical protein
LRGFLALLALLLAAGGAWLWVDSMSVRYTVVRGDTLGKIAKRNSVTVEELRDWNGITGDLIEVDQVLVVGRGGMLFPTLWEAPAEAPETAAPSAKKSRKSRTSKKKRTAKSSPGEPVEEPAETPLRMPKAKECIPPPTGSALGGEESQMVASQGLSRTQISQSMDAFLPELARCIEGDWPTGTVELSLNVACTGRVAVLHVEDDGGMDPTLVACIKETLAFAPFPAHQLPDGMDFRYPVVFSR